jgi:NADPH-dependent 2,4-dienoyl-CoA reductase/sulfur reductase-like enzyme
MADASTPAAWGPTEAEVAVVGGGPAGLAAATRLRERGVGPVVILDREPAAGGIPRHCGHYPFGMREFHRLLRGPDYARRLVDRAAAAGVEIRTETTVVGLAPGGRLQISTADGTAELAARRVLLATGVRETSRAARMVGGQRPLGVVSTGALQSLVYLGGKRPFRRPVILGSELVSFSAILTCRHAGIRPVAMIEEGARVTARRLFEGLPRLLGIPLLLGTRLVAIHGGRRVEGVTVERADGTTQAIEADGVIVSGAFTPEATLCRMGHLVLDPASGGPAVDQFGRCSDPAYLAAGNLLRPVETAGWSWREGLAVGDAIADSLNGSLPETERQVAVALGSPAIKLVVPQRIALPHRAGTLDHLQLRLAHAVRGRLTVADTGGILWDKPVNGLPERRLLVPLDAFIDKICGDTLTISIAEGS